MRFCRCQRACNSTPPAGPVASDRKVGCPLEARDGSESISREGSWDGRAVSSFDVSASARLLLDVGAGTEIVIHVRNDGDLEKNWRASRKWRPQYFTVASGPSSFTGVTRPAVVAASTFHMVAVVGGRGEQTRTLTFDCARERQSVPTEVVMRNRREDEVKWKFSNCYSWVGRYSCPAMRMAETVGLVMLQGRSRYRILAVRNARCDLTPFHGPASSVCVVRCRKLS